MVVAVHHELPAVLAAHYRIAACIGRGGAKQVYRAIDLKGGPDVAIAHIPLVDPIGFRREVAHARRVASEHVAQIYVAFVDHRDDGYLVMEHCDGPTLTSLVRHGPLAAGEAGPLVIAFARGLSAIHAAHVLHRDVKLDNVMLTSSPRGPALKILDFGLSSRARAETTQADAMPFAGTLPYMAREALGGERLDARSDVFAFGVCCYRLLVGGFPIPWRAGEGNFAYMTRLRDAPFDAGLLPDTLPARGLIARMLAPERTQRPYMPEVVAGFEAAFTVADG